MRTISLYDVVTAEEMSAKPNAIKEIEPLAAKLAEFDRTIQPGVNVTAAFAPKSDIENSILKLMPKVDPQKYAHYPSGEGGTANQTPASDGKFVYVTYLPYLVACF